MLDLSSPAVLKDLLARYGFTFSKGLGQNFLINPTVCPRMAELGGAAPGVGMLEIGAGIGVLTAELARRADKVVCIEIDSRLLPILDETLAGFTNVRIVNDDVLKVDLSALLAAEFPGQKVAVCANLPYYITSPILMHLLESRLPLSSITVMVQKEAAARLTAEPGSREVGAISIALRYYCVPRVLFPVSRGSFLPSPDVDSTVIRLDILESPAVPVKDEALFFAGVRAAFSQRRKTLLNCIAGYFSLPKSRAAEILAAAGIPENIRAEQLPLDGFARLADALFDAGVPAKK